MMSSPISEGVEGPRAAVEWRGDVPVGTRAICYPLFCGVCGQPYEVTRVETGRVRVVHVGMKADRRGHQYRTTWVCEVIQ
jgi:hypothetical protein